jgi:hypothetical protein
MGEFIEFKKICNRCNGVGKYLRSNGSGELTGCYKCGGTGLSKKNKFDANRHGKLLSAFGHITKQSSLVKLNQKEILTRLKACEARDVQIKKLITYFLIINKNSNAERKRARDLTFNVVQRWMDKLITQKIWEDLRWIESKRAEDDAEVDSIVNGDKEVKKKISLLQEIIKKNTANEEEQDGNEI